MRLRTLPPLGTSSPAPWLLAATLMAACLSAGCGNKKDKPPTQTAAKVNQEELTVHQINALLAQQRGLRPEQAEEASRRALERLIDQELALQKAAELRLDRDPQVVQSIEAARREIIARAYAEKVSEAVAKPSAAEARKFYETHPALFAERRIYQLQEFQVQAAPAQAAGLQEQLRGARSPADVAQALQAADLKFSDSRTTRAAEQLPMDRLGALAAMKDGQLSVTPVPGGAQVIFVVASRLQSIDEARALPAIEQFLTNDRRRVVIAQDMKALRAAAKIEYVGKFASAASVPSPSVPSAADVAASAAAALETKAASDAAAHPASAAEAATIRKGLGLK